MLRETATASADAHLLALSLQGSPLQGPLLQRRRAIVTGGTTGIGRAIAVQLAAHGARVFVCGRNRQHLDDALADINIVGEGVGGEGAGITLDLAEPEATPRFFSAAEEWFGSPDIAIINAAVPSGGVAEENPHDLAYQTAVDFTAYVAASAEAARRMSAGADIVLIGSMSAQSRKAGSSAYVAAKAGIAAMIPPLRRELADRDIKVGLIEPGFTFADFHKPGIPDEDQKAMIDDKTMLRAEDIADAALFMLTRARRCAVSVMRVEPLRERD